MKHTTSIFSRMSNESACWSRGLTKSTLLPSMQLGDDGYWSGSGLQDWEHILLAMDSLVIMNITLVNAYLPVLQARRWITSSSFFSFSVCVSFSFWPTFLSYLSS